MANVKLTPTSRDAFSRGQSAMQTAHRHIDTILAELTPLPNTASIPIDRLIFILSHEMASLKDEMLATKDDVGAAAIAKEEMGDPLYDFQAALDETIARIDALNTFVQASAPSSVVGPNTFLHFWKLLPDGRVEMHSLTKQQLLDAGLAPLLQGFLDDRI